MNLYCDEDFFEQPLGNKDKGRIHQRLSFYFLGTSQYNKCRNRKLLEGIFKGWAFVKAQYPLSQQVLINTKGFIRHFKISSR